MAQTLRSQTQKLLHGVDHQSRLSRSVHLLLASLIIINVICVILDTVQDLADRYFTLFLIIELICTAVFTIEYILRIWSAPDDPEFTGRGGRLRYMLRPMAIVDLIAILPAFLFLFTSVDLRFIRIVRLLRLLKFTRYSTGLDLMLMVFRQQLGIFGAASAALACMLVFSAGAIYLAEHQVQPDAFGDLPSTLYWSIITLTTVGYGDVVPITAVGKFLASIISLTGIGIVAVPAGILASAFSSELRRREDIYRQQAAHHLSGKRLTEAMRRKLRSHQEELGISDEQAQSIIADIHDVHHDHEDELLICPHCHKPLHLELSEPHEEPSNQKP
ncbi:ion transporter [Thalassospira alkalitolerans]|uniref:Potassium transporter Kef n=1 Tax=Thalassospira alkalitolerans TaxID=1293890 RepID=A0A1Y2LIN9_9PROT|nr:ion transporter [Thalassospira alkalitolerans]OSQ50403.1 potassium transporter Kef [Thalassospira alkalitolerans]|tara:strand:- start:70987 stop:71979 length:993 start_codon:yes stop_codon:yes gene_type:complete